MNSHRFGGGMIEYEFQFELLEVICKSSSLLSWLGPYSAFHRKQNISHMMKLFHQTACWILEAALICNFSDQSHESHQTVIKTDTGRQEIGPTLHQNPSQTVFLSFQQLWKLVHLADVQ